MQTSLFSGLRREALDPCPQRKGEAPLWEEASGILVPSVDLQLRPWSRPHPTRTAGSPRVRDPAGPRWGPQANAPRPTRRAHSPAPPPPPCALPARPSANSGPGLSRRGGWRAGSAPASDQSGAAVRSSRPIHNAPSRFGWTRRKHSRGIPPPPPAHQEPPRRGSVDLPTPPKPRWTVPLHLTEGEAVAGQRPIAGKKGDKPPMGSWGPWATCSWLSVRLDTSTRKTNVLLGERMARAKAWRLDREITAPFRI
ncbi:uncharacterized protein LOC118908555 [Manis pentadactyla]|uniref:uncharacterized protein LOC118908555 n=1 Tax=Manis pentadactyla TaxID=143292 RepID=UPI00255CDBC3|nr:uncharacterized protein LOC118908555 [Manis pentadactyla]